ncbi:MAG: endonuclease III [Bacilli bacterium]
MKNKSEIIINYLHNLYPNNESFLNYKKDYEFLIAVMLSAQTTDIAVNKATDILFAKYPTIGKLHEATYDDIYNIIKNIGIAKIKTNNIIGITDLLISNFDKKVPFEKTDLMTMPGVGNKTANVVRMELFHEPEMPVDTHILRVSKRLGIIKEKENVVDAERELKKMFDEKYYYDLHHQFILFGRNICLARSPKCSECKLKDFCTHSK